MTREGGGGWLGDAYARYVVQVEQVALFLGRHESASSAKNEWNRGERKMERGAVISIELYVSMARRGAEVGRRRADGWLCELAAITLSSPASACRGSLAMEPL